jgi:hypothetical protein
VRNTAPDTWRVFREGHAVALSEGFKTSQEAANWIKSHPTGAGTKDALVYNGTEQQWKEHAVEMHPGCTFRLDPVKSNIIRCRNKQGMNVGQYDTEKKSGSLEE